MPVISFNYKDFIKLVGKKYSMKELEETMPMMGMEWEGSDGDEISVEVFPNRPDLLSVEGLARAYKYFRGLSRKVFSYSANKSNYELIVDDAVKGIRPVIGAMVVKGVKLNENSVKSLMQLQEKLHITHCRNRRKAAIGVHDLRAVKFPVRYTAVDPQEMRFIPLDFNREMTPEEIIREHPKGIKYAHLVENFPAYPMVINADNEILSFPPIINSELTKVRPNTKNLFVDVTGTDENTVSKALNIVATSLIDRGAKVYQVKVHYGKDVKITPDLLEEEMVLDANYCRSLLGEDIPTRSMVVLLRKMGFESSRNEESLKVKIPCYRTDIMHPIDLVEDVAIAYGYENFTPEVPQNKNIGKGSKLLERINYVKDILAGFGFIEVYNWLLTNKKVLFNNMNSPERSVVEIFHPKNADLTVCRDSLLPQLMEFLGKNKHNDYPQDIFEEGKVLIFSDEKVREEDHLAIVSARSKINYSTIKAIVDSLAREMGVKLQVRQTDYPYFIPGRAADLLFKGNIVGVIGEIHPKVLEIYELKVPVVGCELNIEELVK